MYDKKNGNQIKCNEWRFFCQSTIVIRWEFIFNDLIKQALRKCNVEANKPHPFSLKCVVTKYITFEWCIHECNTKWSVCCEIKKKLTKTMKVMFGRSLKCKFCKEQIISSILHRQFSQNFFIYIYRAIILVCRFSCTFSTRSTYGIIVTLLVM